MNTINTVFSKFFTVAFSKKSTSKFQMLAGLTGFAVFIANTTLGQVSDTKSNHLPAYESANPADWPKNPGTVVNAPGKDKVATDADKVNGLGIARVASEKRHSSPQHLPGIIYATEAENPVDYDEK
ncbi:MAG: hypothetical protein ABIR19_04065 [Ginsengibacter sp.]